MSSTADREWFSPYPAPPPGKIITSLPPSDLMTEEEVEALRIDYPDHDSDASAVISGPLGVAGGGPGRRFHSIALASLWAREKYGPRARRIRDAEPGGRWAFRVPRVDLPDPHNLLSSKGDVKP